jgi:hypothetical protein
MKINFIKTIISVCISGLIAYGFYSFCKTDNILLLSLGSFLFLSLTLLFTLGISFSLPRTTTMVRTTSVIFFILAFVSNLIFSFFNFSTPIYIIIIGIALMTYTLIAYSIIKAKQ